MVQMPQYSKHHKMSRKNLSTQFVKSHSRKPVKEAILYTGKSMLLNICLLTFLQYYYQDLVWF